LSRSWSAKIKGSIAIVFTPAAILICILAVGLSVRVIAVAGIAIIFGADSSTARIRSFVASFTAFKAKNETSSSEIDVTLVTPCAFISCLLPLARVRNSLTPSQLSILSALSSLSHPLTCPKLIGILDIYPQCLAKCFYHWVRL